jgi:hypothetical protein
LRQFLAALVAQFPRSPEAVFARAEAQFASPAVQNSPPIQPEESAVSDTGTIEDSPTAAK